MTSNNSEAIYRGWCIEPFAIPSENGNWLGTCEIRQTDCPPSDAAQAMLANVLRKSKREAIADISEAARRQIDAMFGEPV
jgi:hypothetical protein